MSKRKRFKGTPDQHRSHAATALRNMRKLQKDFTLALNAGRCDLALNKLSLHAYQSGVYSGDNSYAKRGTAATRKGYPGRRGSVEKMINMKARYKAKCLR